MVCFIKDTGETYIMYIYLYDKLFKRCIDCSLCGIRNPTKEKRGDRLSIVLQCIIRKNERHIEMENLA